MSRVHDLGKMSYTELMTVWQRSTRSYNARDAASGWNRDQLITAIRDREAPLVQVFGMKVTVLLDPVNLPFMADCGLSKVVMYSKILATDEEAARYIAQAEAVRMIPENRISEITVEVSS